MRNEFPGKYGFKNAAPAFTKDSWSGVELFLDTWGFLPADDSYLDKLNRQDLTRLCNLCLGVACRLDMAGDGIKIIQEYLHECKLSPEAMNNNKPL